MPNSIRLTWGLHMDTLIHILDTLFQKIINRHKWWNTQLHVVFTFNLENQFTAEAAGREAESLEKYRQIIFRVLSKLAHQWSLCVMMSL